MCWFNQIGKIGRDNTPAKNSLVQFNRLIEQYPDSGIMVKQNRTLYFTINAFEAEKVPSMDLDSENR